MVTKKKTKNSVKKVTKTPPKVKTPVVNNLALLPILVFVLLYLGVGIIYEYVLKIPMGFYNIPIVVVFMIALLVACMQNKNLKLDDKFEVMSRGVGDKCIMQMIIIFLLAGMFVGVVGRESAASVAYFVLSFVPAKFAVLVMFLVSCFVSISMGTSVGTITLITPIAYQVAKASNLNMAFVVATVIGGAMFGDNLSFISDTTIAACQGQGCKMKDKFRENIKIAVPAALVTLAVIYFISMRQNIVTGIIEKYDLIKIIPYILVLVGGIIGINVFVVLLIGIISGSIIMLTNGGVNYVDLISQMGSGVSGMFETIMVAILVAALGALIKEFGGIDAVIYHVKNIFKGRKMGMVGLGCLVGMIDIATANNTVAIIIANPIASELAKGYKIENRKVASILDTFSCVFQGIIPYGAQMLVAISAVASLGGTISAFEIIPMLFYPFALLIFSLIFIAVDSKK